MYVRNNLLQSSGSRNKSPGNWKLFQILCILQNCLILQVACRSGSSIPGGHGLLRNTINGVFMPVNYTSVSQIEDVIQTRAEMKSSGQEEEITTSTSTGILDSLTDNFKEKTVSPQEPEEEGDYYEEDTNKAKRSKGFVKRLLQKFGLASAPSEPPQREREFEAQMADDGNMDADSAGGGGDETAMTTSRPGGLLSKLNPINKISYKINTARNLANRALNVVGLGSKPAGTEGSDGGSGGENNGEDEGTTRDGGMSGDSNSGTNAQRRCVGILMVTIAAIFVESIL